jgi:hypothetical protein
LEINVSSLLETKRIHAIVLTHNRADTLRRCIATALAPLNEQDLLTVIDDSVPSAFSANSDVLTTASKSSSVKLVHISPARVQQILPDLAPFDCHWLEKTARRDISPLRNISLLFSTAASAETTILVDDDIVGFDLLSTHKRIGDLARAHGEVIAGAELGGTSELDTITRLGEAFQRLVKSPTGQSLRSIRELFGAGECWVGTSQIVKYLSAGYLAFRFSPKQLFAFPPGYNEDWLWCLLHAANSQIQLANLGERVIHDPPSILKPTKDDLLFELFGDFVFQYLNEQGGVKVDPESSLRLLADRLLNPAFRPSTRVRKLLLRIEASTNGNHSRTVLEDLGLSPMRDLLRSGELDLDEGQLLEKWCHDALQKHQAFERTLRNGKAMAAIQELLLKGRI